MAMHRLPPGTEAPRWRVVAAVWGLSVLLAFALSVALRLTWGVNAAITLPLLWLAIQWAAWLHIKDRPARTRRALYSEAAPDGPIVRLAAMEEDSPHTGARSGDLGLGDAVDRPGRHSVKEEAEVTEPEIPAGCRDDDPSEFWNRAMERIIDWFNPPDEDAACESIVLDAIERAYKFAEAQPCTCPPDDMGPDQEFEACQRCQVLGRVQDTEVAR